VSSLAALAGRLRRWRPEDRFSCLGAYALLLAWCWPLVADGDSRGSPVYVDWEWFLAYYQVLRSTLLDHGQFPGFNPYMYLGSPLWANPQIGPVTHITPLVLGFGVVHGMKLGLAACYFISFETARALGRALFQRPLPAVVAGLLYALNTGVTSQLILGHGCFIAYCLAPLLVLYCLRLTERRWAGAAAGAVAGLMVHYGIHYYLIYAFALCGLLVLCRGVRRRAWADMARFGALFGLFLLAVSAVRLLPILEVMADHPRKLWLPFGLDARALWQMFGVPGLEPGSFSLDIRQGGVQFSLVAGEFRAYPGLLVVAAAALSLRWGVRWFHLGALLSLLLLLGTYQPWHLSRWLGLAPPFDAMWVVTRWRVMLLACLAFAAAQGVDGALGWLEERGRSGAVTLGKAMAWALPLELLLLLAPDWNAEMAAYRDRPMSRAGLGIPATKHMLSVRQVHRVWKGAKSTPYFAMFRANLGAAAGYDPLFGYLPARSIRTHRGHPDYRGEYVVDGEAVTPDSWSPNRIQLTGLVPGATLEVNLNPGRGWTVNGEPLFEGLKLFELRRRFVAKVPASGEVELRYTPPGLIAGMLTGLVCALVLLAWWWRERRPASRAAPLPSALLCLLLAACSDPAPTSTPDMAPPLDAAPPDLVPHDLYSGPAGDAGTDPYGGFTRVKSKGSGYFRVEQVDGRWWFITPDGNGFLSMGVNTVTPNTDVAPKLGYSPYNKNILKLHGTEQAWADKVASRYASWGFNTLGAWSKDSLFKKKLAYTRVLYLSGASWGKGGFPDVYDPKWAARVKTEAQKACAGSAKDPYLIGYFLDNEVSWTVDHRNLSHLLDRFLGLDATAAGKIAAVASLKKRHQTVAAFNMAWGTKYAAWDDLLKETKLTSPALDHKGAKPDREAFLAETADAYFKILTAEVKAADPNHLILGNRWIGLLAPRAVVKVAGKYCDVVSVNPYEFTDIIKKIAQLGQDVVSPADHLKEIHQVSGRPVLVSEFGWRAADSGLPNTYPPVYPTLKTQAHRAARYRAYVEGGAATPWMVGWHWFQHADQPKEGRFDGENNNWGVVNIKDEPYSVVVDEMARVNRRAALLHRGWLPSTPGG